MSRTDKSFLAKKVISADGPSPKEEEHNVSLADWCTSWIEPEEEANRRRSVLEHINNIVRAWIRSTMITEFRMPAEAAAQVEGRIFATGSYRYNVHASGSDIDIVLIAPNRITREHFFNTLASRLQHEPRITELQCISDAHVPLIAMKADGIDIDMSFGSIRQDRVPEVITDDLLQGLDDQSVLSCNAVRVAHNIMDLVPHKASFRQALRFIKAWGKSRAIYSNKFGFPSGIGWAILVAFVCQCHPNQNAAGTVVRFFRIYNSWFSPNPHESGRANRAIYLTETMRVKTNLGRCWDPRESKSDAMALFPVLTPAVPYGNACYNVTLTNLRQLCSEFARGHEICNAYLGRSAEEAKSEFGPYGVWNKLLEPVKFFGEYKYYLHVQISCSDPEIYKGYVEGVESKIRFLWYGTAEMRGSSIENSRHVTLQLNPRGYEDPEEVEERNRQLQRPARSNTGGQAPPSQRSSGGGPSTAGASLTGTATAGGTPAPRLFSCHYYIGICVDPTAPSGKIDLAPSIRAFHNVVRQLRQYREGITRLPAITVEDISKIPSFVKEAAGYKDPEATAAAAELAQAAADGAGPSAGTKRTREDEECRTDDAHASDAQTSDGDAAKKTLTSEPQTTAATNEKPNTIGNNDACGTENSLNALVDNEDDLEQALGMDF